jgi:hypothetical protein
MYIRLLPMPATSPLHLPFDLIVLNILLMSKINDGPNYAVLSDLLLCHPSTAHIYIMIKYGKQ